RTPMARGRNTVASIRWVVVVATMLLGVPGAIRAEEPVAVQLDWTWWAGLIPFHVALEKGYYTDVGLSVTVQQGQGAASTVAIVGAGTSPIGHANQAVTAQFVSKGVPVTAVATFWQRTTLGLLGLDDTTIKVPKDIEGKRVGSTPTGVDPQVLPAFAGAT